MKLRLATIAIGLALLQSAGAQNADRQFAIDNYQRYQQEALQCRDAAKREAMKTIRGYFQEHPTRLKISKDPAQAIAWLESMTEQGTFPDMDVTERYFEENDLYNKVFHNTPDDEVGIFIGNAFERIFQITGAFRSGSITGKIPDKILKAILHYGEMEICRSNSKPRFHASCFAIPVATSNVYFSMLELMDRAERGEGSRLLSQACDMLKTVALEAWTQPLRGDETDQNVVTIERFRNHVWWVGGNAIGYRPLLPVAAMYSSIPMVDLISEICQKSLSTTSQTTNKESFWTEGFTEDGAGWGHGRQCLVWGYPIDGAESALRLLSILNGTPWAKTLTRENADALMNYFRGSNWYYYKGYRLPGIDRKSYVHNPSELPIPYRSMLDNVVEDWISSFSEAEQKELLQLQEEVHRNRIDMENQAPGTYHGLRWFYNNDDLMKKNKDYHLCINMTSYRCDGLESATFADRWNFHPADGATLFQREGNEYFKVMGGWDVTAIPGVTAREGMEELTPVTNWRGYCSVHDFAAAVTDGQHNGTAGFISEKINGNDKKRGPHATAPTEAPKRNAILYGHQAWKGYFILDDFMIALGAGITDKMPYKGHELRTTIDQTALEQEVRITGNGKPQILHEGVTRLPGNSRKTVWLTQKGKFSYSILPEYTSEAWVSLEKKATDWTGRNPENANRKNLPAEVSILRIWINHGTEAKQDSYGYTVYMGEGKAPARLPFRVISNTTSIQAVQSKDGKTLQALFYSEKESLDYGECTIGVSAPCAVMLEKRGKETLLFVTDAMMDPDLKKITVTLNGKAYTAALPQGKHCGNQAVLTIKD